MESRTICQWCASLAGTLVRGIISTWGKIRECVQKPCKKVTPAGLPKIEIEEIRTAKEEKKPTKERKLRKTTFKYHDADAKEVKMAGDFTNWKTKSMDKKGPGDWSITVNLSPGRYYYKFVVDDKWTKDPRNPKSELDNYGGEGSIIDVKEPKKK